MKKVLRLRKPVERVHELTAGVLQIGDGYGIRLVSTGTHSQGNGPKRQTALVEIGEVIEVEIDKDGKEIEVERRPIVAEAATEIETVPTNYEGADIFDQLQDDTETEG